MLPRTWTSGQETKTNTQCNARKTSMRQPKNHALTKTAFTPHCVALQPEATGANPSGWPRCDGCRRRSRRRHRQCLPRVGIGACTQGGDTSSSASALPWWSGSERTTLHGDRTPPGEEGACVFPAVDEESPRGRARGTPSVLCLRCTFSVPLCMVCVEDQILQRLPEQIPCNPADVPKFSSPHKSSLSLFSLFAADNAKNW